MLTRKCQNKAEAKRDSVINPQNYNFIQFYTDNFENIESIKQIFNKKRYDKTT